MTTTAAALGPEPKPGILDIAPYVPGKAGDGSRKMHKLSSNESATGASPKALQAFRDAVTSLERYPDGSASALRDAIGRRYGLDPDRIICGAGSDELLGLIAHAYLRPGDEAIYSQYGFLVYPIAIKANGATAVIAPERDQTTDIDAMLARVNERTRIVFLANPNNPTGTYVPASEVRRLHAALPRTCLLVLDAAYAEFVRRNDYEAGIELAGSYPNVIMTRTFSKVYGLAAARVGWAFGPAAVIDVLNRIRGPFNVGAAAIAASAAAVGDTAFVEDALSHNDQWLPWLTKEIERLGISVTPSVCNFLLLNFPEHRPAPKADQFLTERGFVLRRMEAYGLPGALRLTVGNEEANRGLVAALAEFMA